MDVIRTTDVADFMASARSFLEAREAEHNLIFGITADVAAYPSTSVGPPYLASVVDRGVVRLAAIRTPPWNLVVSELDDEDALDPLVADLAAWAPADSLPGVVGPAETAEAFAARWSAATGHPARLAIRERIFRLSVLRPPVRPPGTIRVADRSDRALMIDWMDGFHADAFGDAPQPEASATSVDGWSAGRRTLHLWIDGEPVSMCGVGGPTPNGIRIGPVYTPPAKRGRGYASALTAAVSQAQLDGGRRFVFLLTDLANPTSNHIYQAIGYQPVRDVSLFEFGRRGSAGSELPVGDRGA